MKDKISFRFQPHSETMKLVKAEGEGAKHRYIAGISSGMKLDAHGERMTANCIKSFMEQANSGNVLLYPDIHGIESSNDIGILDKAQIRPDGDWYTEYRLYDEADEIGQIKKEKIDTIWKQVEGLPPYRKPMRKGFSIEGSLPEDGIIEMSDDGRRVIDRVELDGVILVPKPAYQDSIANAVYKALHEATPEQLNNVKVWFSSSIEKAIDNKKLVNKAFSRRVEIQKTFDDMIENILNDKNIYKQQRLEMLFKEYSNLMIPLIIDSTELARKDGRKEEILKELNKLTPVLKSIIRSTSGGKYGRSTKAINSK